MKMSSVFSKGLSWDCIVCYLSVTNTLFADSVSVGSFQSTRGLLGNMFLSRNMCICTCECALSYKVNEIFIKRSCFV